ncbi:hypothetical protein ACLKA7_005966 [Drosophila subpalustris]
MQARIWKTISLLVECQRQAVLGSALGKRQRPIQRIREREGRAVPDVSLRALALFSFLSHFSSTNVEPFVPKREIEARNGRAHH